MFNKKSIYNSIVFVELKKLFRNVTFFIQCVLPTLVMPGIILVSVLTAQKSLIEVNPNSSVTLKFLFAFLITQFFMMMNQISATAISRDGTGETLYYKSLPIERITIIDAKAMPSIYVGFLNLIISTIFNFFIFE